MHKMMRLASARREPGAMRTTTEAVGSTGEVPAGITGRDRVAAISASTVAWHEIRAETTTEIVTVIVAAAVDIVFVGVRVSSDDRRVVRTASSIGMIVRASGVVPCGRVIRLA